MASNGMVNLQDFLKDIKTNYSKELEKAASGPSGAFDGPPLPVELEYRVVVDTAEYKPSKAGNWQIVVTYEVQEPTEHAGRKVQEYYATQPGNEIAQKKVTQVLGALGPDLSDVGNDWEKLTSRLIGLSAVITARTWGENNDRSGVRWINADRGQTLRTNIAPQKAKDGPLKSLRPDVAVQKPAPATAPSTAVSEPSESQEALKQDVVPAVLPGTSTPRPAGGPNLPPGLR